MRKFGILGCVAAALLLAGCAKHQEALNDAWSDIVAQNYGGAKTQYEAILAKDPNNPYANLNAGVASEQMGDTASAAKYYQVAIANGEQAGIDEVAQDGKTAGRQTTVAKVARENLARIGS
jgi:tetratricopeptide (TPR) repeat protein